MIGRVQLHICCFFFFKQKTAYEMRISDWSSDVCSSDLMRRWVVAHDLPINEAVGMRDDRIAGLVALPLLHPHVLGPLEQVGQVEAGQLGRASCRERVCQYV